MDVSQTMYRHLRAVAGQDLQGRSAHTLQPTAAIASALQNVDESLDLTGIVELRETSGTVVESTAEHVDLTGYPEGAVVRLSGASLQADTHYDVVFTAETLVDDWNNGIAASTTRVRFQTTTGVLHTGVHGYKFTESACPAGSGGKNWPVVGSNTRARIRIKPNSAS